MTQPPTASIPPGYYTDNEGVMRWWNGQDWTEQVQPPLPPQPPQVYVPAKNPGVAVLLSFFLPGLAICMRARRLGAWCS
jgi:Protein of unknown function (DUF2510)